MWITKWILLSTSVIVSSDAIFTLKTILYTSTTHPMNSFIPTTLKFVYNNIDMTIIIYNVTFYQTIVLQELVARGCSEDNLAAVLQQVI